LPAELSGFVRSSTGLLAVDYGGGSKVQPGRIRPGTEYPLAGIQAGGVPRVWHKGAEAGKLYTLIMIGTHTSCWLLFLSIND
jgi:hypothetical protein